MVNNYEVTIEKSKNWNFRKQGNHANVENKNEVKKFNKHKKQDFEKLTRKEKLHSKVDTDSAFYKLNKRIEKI